MKSLMTIAILFLGLSAQAQVWTATNTWTPEWQAKYVAWVKSSWNIEVFTKQTTADGKPNPYLGLRTDCADTVYSMRVIFMYENKLPFVINDPTSSGHLITNDIARFNNLPMGTPRIRAFLNFIYQTVSTQTMPGDTYPVALTKETVHAGMVLKTVQFNHHSWSVKDILPIGVPHLIFNSTVGASTGSLLQERKSWPNPEWVFEGDQTPAGHAGFRDWKPYSHLQRPEWEAPGYSEEQYKIPLSKWNDVATARLQTLNESDSARMQRLTDQACTDLSSRISAVSDGINYLNSSGGKCMDFATYDTYSTPNRDQRFFDDLVALRRSFKDLVVNHKTSVLPAKLVSQLYKVFPMIQSRAKEEAPRMPKQDLSEASLCSISYATGTTIDLAEAKRRLFLNLMSNNPLDDLSYRWGELSGHSSRALSCQAWEPWAPDLDKAD